jgi:hypothetical protein
MRQLGRGLTLFLLLVPAVAASHAAAPECHRVVLDPRPGQISSMVWSLDGRELIATDVSQHQLLRISPQGRLVGSVPEPAFLHGEFKPTQVHVIPEGFLVRNSAYDWIWFDRDFKPLRSAGPSLPHFAMINDAPVGDQLFGFGTFRKSTRAWSFGLLQVRFTPAVELVKVIREVSSTTKAGDLHSYFIAITALAGGIPFALQFDEPSYILNLQTGQRLKAFPPGYEHLPVLPKNTGDDSAGERERAIDDSTVPVALYGRGGFLYLLTREAKPPGKPVWRLHRIDPQKDVLLSSVTLPTSAAQVELAPGPGSWAILEESSVPASGTWRGESLLLIPAAAIDQGGVIPSCG